MLTRKFCCYTLVLLLVPSVAQAQTGDWGSVQTLRPGSAISVKAKDRPRLWCHFDHADDDALSCERIGRGISYSGSAEIVVARRDVQEVRLEHSDRANATDGAVLGGVVGAAVGGAVGGIKPNGNGTRAAIGALILGGTGALFGMAFGKDFPVRHGKVVYKR